MTIVSALLLLLTSAVALAHDNGLARIGLVAPKGEAELRITLDARTADLRQVLGLPEKGPLPTKVFDRALPPAIGGWLTLAAHDAPCPLRLESWAPFEGVALRLTLVATCAAPPHDLSIDWPAADNEALRWAALVVLDDRPEAVDPIVLDRGFTSAMVRVGEPPPIAEVVFRFGRLGVSHILTGWDHLAFVLALMLGCGRIRRLVAVVTAFTAAHSITLALGATGVVALSPVLVESLIALSIAVAAGIVLRRLRDDTLDHPGRAEPIEGGAGPLVAVCFGFGLMHGFGFAGQLADALPVGGGVGWPLLGFNLGVELGQVACVLLLLPPLTWAGRSRHARRVFGGLAAVLLLLGVGLAGWRLI